MAVKRCNKMARKWQSATIWLRCRCKRDADGN